MEAEHTRALVLGTAVALGTVLLARADFAAAALWTGAATLLALHGALYPAGLAALPVLFAAMQPAPGPTSLPPPGPVRIAGTVVAVRFDPLRDERAVLVDIGGGRVPLRCRGGPELLPGDRLRATARCAAPSIPGRPARLSADGAALVVEPGAWSLPRACAAIRAALERRLLELVPGDRGALLANLVLGHGTRLPEEHAAAHRATGLSHLLAVSGAHAAMLAWLLGLQPFGGGRRRPVGRRHLLLALPLLIVYGAITGMEPPVFRALCSYVLVGLGLRLGRRVSAVQGLLWPALLSAVLTPDAVLGPSFCLSYAAVFGLALASGPRTSGRAERLLWAPMRASAWATLTTAPLTLLWFSQIAPWTVLLTPLLAPLVGALLFLGLGVSLLALSLPPLATALAPTLDSLTGVYLSVVATADSLPGTPVHAAWAPPGLLLLAFGAAAAAICLLLRSRTSVVLGCIVAAVPHWLPQPPAGPALHLFAVGHGQACLATLADGTTVLIDCGSLQHPMLAAHRVETALRRRCIDVLVLTHGDHDHTSAVPELLRRLPVRRALLPASMRDSAVRRLLGDRGCEVALLPPGARARPCAGVEVTAPAITAATANDASLWTRLELGPVRVLATGDAEEAGVEAAVECGVAAPADVLLLPHHGRPNARAAVLLAAVRPVCCLVSNRHGDGPPALGRLAADAGVPTFATGVLGDLRVDCGGEPAVSFDGGLPLVLRTR